MPLSNLIEVCVCDELTRQSSILIGEGGETDMIDIKKKDTS